MAYDITNERPLSIATTPIKRTTFTNATATTAWTAGGAGPQGISFLRTLIYATAASAATFQVEVADDASGTNPIIVTPPTAAVSAAAAFELRGTVPVAGKTHFRIVRGGTSATFDAFVEVV